MNTVHIPVLLKEIIDNTHIKSGDAVFDGTLGGGGYAHAFASIVGKNGLVAGTDLDADALKRVQAKTYDSQTHFTQGSYSKIAEIAHELDIQFDMAVLDLGLSSDQLDVSGRGFSFKDRKEPLDMSYELAEDRMTASDVLNTWSQESIADIIFGFGGERYSRRIAKNICEDRENVQIETVGQLVDIISRSVPSSYRHKKTHPATKTFQALRIAVNSEWQHIQNFLEHAHGALKDGGHIAIVSFHSGEDKVIKHTFRKWQEEGKGLVVTKKPIKPTEQEVAENPRSRSALLRIITVTH